MCFCSIIAYHPSLSHCRALIWFTLSGFQWSDLLHMLCHSARCCPIVKRPGLELGYVTVGFVGDMYGISVCVCIHIYIYIHMLYIGFPLAHWVAQTTFKTCWHNLVVLQQFISPTLPLSFPWCPMLPYPGGVFPGSSGLRRIGSLDGGTFCRKPLGCSTRIFLMLMVLVMTIVMVICGDLWWW